ncbi:MAG: TetR/AcrR family transcriptional regulator [Porphyrobacter sp. IPPAS B-1204]|nr:MAG: TetR/AcrR family transcriptional regulator [Porphyrobacter sp. IPPAS B-1204]
MVRAEAKTGADLREACLTEALAIISASGVEKLSLREVARRLGVSHQAPYRHFASRDHVLAEIVRRAFADFASALRSPPHTDNPATDTLAMGMAYVAFAFAEPLKYRLMFGGTLPEPDAHPEMMRGAREAFNVLRAALVRLFEARGQQPDHDLIDREALFAWSSLHGVVSLMRTDAIDTLDLAPSARAAFVAHALQKVGTALGIDVQGTRTTGGSQ